ncbi:hypothetical protein [Bartonella sp. AC70YNML]|uniref:hypothetical protein n=1 Tax=Bartonella sp. AC70YNML TaxID=3243460 RepID=UPI0035D00681
MSCGTGFSFSHPWIAKSTAFSLLSCGTGFSFSYPWVAMGNGQGGGIHLFFSLCMRFGKLL